MSVTDTSGQTLYRIKILFLLAVNDFSDAPQVTVILPILNHCLSPFPVYYDQANDGRGILKLFVC